MTPDHKPMTNEEIANKLLLDIGRFDPITRDKIIEALDTLSAEKDSRIKALQSELETLNELYKERCDNANSAWKKVEELKMSQQFCDKHLNVRDCGFAHPFVTNDGKCGFCELKELRSKLQRLEEALRKIQKEVASEPDNRWCRNALIIAQAALNDGKGA